MFMEHNLLIIFFPEDSSGNLHHHQGIQDICLCWDRPHFCLCLCILLVLPDLGLHYPQPPDQAGEG